MKTKRIIAALALFLSIQSIWAQQYSERVYNRWVSQYSNHISGHYWYSGWDGAVYGGLMWSSINGDQVEEKQDLFGIDAGLKYTYIIERSNSPVKFEVNCYLDLNLTGFTSSDSEYDEEDEYGYSDCAAQIAITPGIRIGFFSIDCGPYIGYMGFYEDEEKKFTVSGLDYGLRMGCAVHFKKYELGVHYNLGLTDHDKKIKKNDLMVTFAYKFKLAEL